MSEVNLILYEPIESENGLSCPYPGCNKCVDVTKRTQLEAHIRSHRKRKRKNKNAVSVETIVNDDVKVEIVEIKTEDQSTSINVAERLENDKNQNKRIEGVESDSSQGEAIRIRCPVSHCDKSFDEAMSQPMCEPNSQKIVSISGPTEIDNTLSKITDVSESNDDKCVDFTVKIEENPPEQCEMVPVENDLSPETTIQSGENEIILPIDDENHEMKPDIKADIEEIDNSVQRENDWFFVKDEDSLKRMFVCRLCFAEYEYLHQLHRHAFACPHKAKIGHAKITSFVKKAFTPYSSTRKRPQPPKLVRTKGNFYCDLCQQVGQAISK